LKLISSVAGIIQLIQENICIVEGLGKQGEGGGRSSKRREGGAAARGGRGDELGKLSTVV